MATNGKQLRGSPRLNSHPQAPVTSSMPLDALRDSRQLTQVQMAQLLKISQGAVSKVERRTDMFISTLRNYVRAAGGNLQIRAVFPDGDVLIDQFDEVQNRQHAALNTRGSEPAEKEPRPSLNTDA